MLAAPTLCGLSGMILLSDDASTIAGHHGACRRKEKGEVEGREGEGRNDLGEGRREMRD
jgi:hypothetical protein